MYRLNPDLDIGGLAAAFARYGRVRIRSLVSAEQAERLAAWLRAREDWLQVINSGETLIELDRQTRAAMEPAQRTALDQAVRAGARYSFQHRYEALRVPDDDAARAARCDPLAAFARFLSSAPVIAILRNICGAADIAFADAQATAYAPGDFLTAHDDNVAGKGRRAAYVFGLNPAWRPEWGGLLLFHGDGAGPVEAYVPEMNCLNLFSVPQVHSVTEVSAAAPYRRYAVTGWLRQETAAPRC